MMPNQKKSWSLAALLALVTGGQAWTGPKTSIFSTPVCRTYQCIFQSSEAQPAGYRGTPDARTNYYYTLRKLQTHPSGSPDNNPVLQVTRNTQSGAIKFLALSWPSDDYSLNEAPGRAVIAALAGTYLTASDFKNSPYRNATQLANACYVMNSSDTLHVALTSADKEVTCGYNDWRFVFTIGSRGG